MFGAVTMNFGAYYRIRCIVLPCLRAYAQFLVLISATFKDMSQCTVSNRAFNIVSFSWEYLCGKLCKLSIYFLVLQSVLMCTLDYIYLLSCLLNHNFTDNFVLVVHMCCIFDHIV